MGDTPVGQQFDGDREEWPAPDADELICKNALASHAPHFRHCERAQRRGNQDYSSNEIGHAFARNCETGYADRGLHLGGIISRAAKGRAIL